ncbi:alpha/beta fold hydrolase [Streptosporangium pseudovulgare]|uniref:Haloalkane dehalogenase n=1 Tax=Streptosporangium pseudovulgare TaxID=35765 RepID=A0ABQ2QN23_9ACTN|nr:alpha/beta fold hydrolase [Streptosporangium pseudovulgare]GGP89076.1 haloalkane dehalogenase [Streptosporangium pseudovulgare]
MRMDVNGVELEVQVSGEGRDVVLLHGYPDTHACWRHQVAALNAAGYRTIAPDLRGFGASAKPDGLENYRLSRYVGDLLGIMDRLGVERAHLVGHDWGSPLVQLTAVAAPQRALSLTCMSVGHPATLAAAGPVQWRRSWYMLLFQLRGVAEWWLSRDDFATMRRWMGGHPDVEDVIARMRDPRALTSSLAIYRTGLRPLPSGRVAKLPPVPTLGVWSSGDRFLAERAMLLTQEHVTGPWRYERIDGAGHWMQLEAPDRVNALLLDFLSAATPPR